MKLLTPDESIPPEIIEAAIKVTKYFSERRIIGWKLAGCADRFPWRRPGHVIHCNTITGNGEPDYIGPPPE